ncbi:hypothetical protein BS47DRAFT_952475 [Hydnum rufescens UP504]|uniref:Secreted protein n=1 Tax=Hydnum rufescens UP504 TaxID=1448309 RepID=A0A9P6DWE3_9AGAM|nr:hypothetical protein BS47DRAFT_952475 [Hydnum rufescens UP504]
MSSWVCKSWFVLLFFSSPVCQCAMYAVAVGVFHVCLSVLRFVFPVSCLFHWICVYAFTFHIPHIPHSIPFAVSSRLFLHIAHIYRSCHTPQVHVHAYSRLDELLVCLSLGVVKASSRPA